MYINLDNIAKDTFGDWNSSEAVLKAAILSTELREACISEGKSLIFETVLSTYDKIDFIKRAKSKGYFFDYFLLVPKVQQLMQVELLKE